MKEKILEMLRSEGDFLSGETISARLGVSRAAVWKVIQKLKEEGYAIESVPNRGYRLSEATARLCLSEIRANLPKYHPWRDLIRFQEDVDSTNTRLKLSASQGAPHGSVLIADHQTGGRGRRGRSFASPPNMGIYLSALLRPQCRPEDLMHLTCAVAEAMVQAIEDAAGFRPGIKWTNDLVSGTRKLTGILTELSLEAESGCVNYAVIGIGVNCRQELSDFPEELQEMAGSLHMVTGGPIDRNKLAAAMVRRLYEMDQNLLSDKAAILDAYRRDCITLGQDIVLLQGEEKRYGKALDIDSDGALVVAFTDGTVGTVNSGEVSVRGMYGYV